MQIDKKKNKIVIFNDDDELIGVVRKVRVYTNNDSKRNQIENYDISINNKEKHSESIVKVKKLQK